MACVPLIDNQAFAKTLNLACLWHWQRAFRSCCGLIECKANIHVSIYNSALDTLFESAADTALQQVRLNQGTAKSHLIVRTFLQLNWHKHLWQFLIPQCLYRSACTYMSRSVLSKPKCCASPEPAIRG